MQSIWLRLLLLYRRSLLGACGAVIGAYVFYAVFSGWFAIAQSSAQRFVLEIGVGLIFGGCTSAFPTLIEGLKHYSAMQCLRRVSIAAICGGMGAMAIAPFAEWIHGWLGGGTTGRAVAWSLFGSSIGIAEAINGGARWWRGIAGGVFGGVCGGLALEHFLDPSKHQTYAATAAIALLGLCIFLLMTLFIQVLSDAWLEGLDGSKVAGQIYQLGKYRAPNVATIGSARQAGVLVWIPDAETSHATISITHEGAEICSVAKTKPTLVGDRPIVSTLLRDGDVIQIGGSKLLYRQSVFSRFLFSSFSGGDTAPSQNNTIKFR